MSGAAQRVLETFEDLPVTDQQEVAAEILRRALSAGYSAPDEDDLTLAADQVFLELDRREGSE